MRRAAPLAAALAVLVCTSWAFAVPTPTGPAGGVAQESADVEHGAYGDHHDHIGAFNWVHGFVGEKEGAEPGLLWRPPGMPPPFVATLLNYAVLFLLLYRFGAKPIGEALRKRKDGVMKGIEDAAAMKKDASARLRDYENKLKRIDDEIERVKREMREAGERERDRILAEAKERRERMERDATLLIEQELKEARLKLHRDTVQSAVRFAEDALERQVGAADQQRLADEYLNGIEIAVSTTRGGVS